VVLPLYSDFRVEGAYFGVFSVCTRVDGWLGLGDTRCARSGDS
jgi:hypothetical protein